MYIVRSKYKIVLFFIFSILLITKGLCQKFIFDHFGNEEGFEASQALSIAKGRDGYLWVGSENGLYRFDGHQFKTYISDLSTSVGFSGNYFQNLTMDKHNRLWVSVGTNSLNIFDIDRNEIIRYADEKISLGGFAIRSMYYDVQNDVMWISSDKGLYYSQGKNICLHKYSIHGVTTEYLKGHIQIEKNGNIWIANEYGLHYFDETECSFTTYKNPFSTSGKKNENDLLTFYIESDSLIWLGGYESGLYKFYIREKVWKNFDYADPKQFNNGVFQILPMKEDKDLLWLATFKGLQTFHKKEQTFVSYTNVNTYDPYGVPGICFSLLQTESEGLWIGTWKGLHRFDPYKHFIKSTDIPELKKYGAPNPGNLVFESNKAGKDSIIWFYNPYGEIHRYDLTNNKMAAIPAKLLPYCKGTIQPQKLFIDSKNRLWISSFNKGLTGYDLSNDTIIRFDDDFKKTGQVFEVAEDNTGQIWLGCYTGLYKLEGNTIVKESTLSNFQKKIGAMPFIYNFIFDHSGNLWQIPDFNDKNKSIILKYNIRQKTIQKYDANSHKVLGKLDNINKILFFDHNKLAITSFHGLAIGTVENNDLFLNYHSNVGDKLINTCYSIGSDEQNLFISCDAGIIRMSKTKNFGFLYTNTNSTLGPETAPEITISPYTNKVYISQKHSLQYFFSRDIPKKASYPLLLSTFVMNDSIIEPTPKTEDIIELRYDQNNLRFTFSNFNFTNAHANVYEYKLKKGHEWIRVSGNTLDFASLQPGDYLLSVRAVNSFNIPSPEEFKLYINVSPPWYQTWWFQSLTLVIVSGIIYGFFKYRDIQRQKLERLRLSIARDLHDDMGSNLSYIRMLSEREAMRTNESSPYKAIAEKTGEVMNSMSEIIWSINPKYESLQFLFSKVQEFAVETLEPQGIEVEFNQEEIPNSIKLSPENRRHYFLILKEAINNAAKYSKAKKVILSLHISSQYFTTTLVDDGIGFDPLLISKGNGLKNMADRAALLKAKFDIKTGEKGTRLELVMYRKNEII